MLAVALCGCGPKPEEPPAVHGNPLGEYAELAAEPNDYLIERLLDDLIAVGDYENAGYIVNAEYERKGVFVDFTTLSAMFAGHEAAVNIEVWTDRYVRDNRNLEPENGDSLAARFERMRAYSAAVNQHFSTDISTFAYLLEQRACDNGVAISDSDGSRLAQCGAAAAGKVLVCLRRAGSDHGTFLLSVSAALPEDRVPASLDEVEFVIWVEESTETVGHYSNGGTAKRLDYTLTLVRYPEADHMLNLGTVQGGRPPGYINGNQASATGSPPGPDKVAPMLAYALERIIHADPS
jgi:hypothetical protein